ncbi:MAG TPA: SufE family protein [Paludibacteraceae bacterium]|nr:SufE family protein [Paludibacteraceae bacterium]HQB68853.1 SufE family protein [Paludibacteraceae bacterium]HRS68011.1 SufE family protein [Paludibacteraceae bacterium]
MTLEEKQTEIIDEFSPFEDWMDRYQYLVELGNGLGNLPETDKIEQNIIQGCQSNVWLTADYKDGLIYYHGESDAVIVKGIVSLLIRVLSGCTPDEIINSDLHFIDKIGLKEHLSPTRSNGLLAMVKQMKLYALAYKAKYANS